MRDKVEWKDESQSGVVEKGGPVGDSQENMFTMSAYAKAQRAEAKAWAHKMEGNTDPSVFHKPTTNAY